MSLALTAPRSAFSLSSLAPRFLQPYLRPTWSIPCEPSSSSSSSSSTLPALASDTALPAPAISRWSLGLQSLLELIPPIVLAVPKKKTSHSKKRMRMANKYLKNRTNLNVCPACGNVHLSHNICPSCYSQISRQWKAERRGDIRVLGPAAVPSPSNAESSGLTDDSTGKSEATP